MVTNEQKAGKRILRRGTSVVGLTLWRVGESNVDYSFEVYRGALFGGGAEFPLAEGLHGVGVELLIDAAHQLNAVNGAVAANHGVQHDFSFHMFSDQSGRILRIDLP